MLVNYNYKQEIHQPTHHIDSFIHSVKTTLSPRSWAQAFFTISEIKCSKSGSSTTKDVPVEADVDKDLNSGVEVAEVGLCSRPGPVVHLDDLWVGVCRSRPAATHSVAAAECPR
jgi:hypothetical protein